MLPRTIEELKFEHCKYRKDSVIWKNNEKAIMFNAKMEVFFIWTETRKGFKLFKNQEAMLMIDELLSYFEISLDEANSVLFIHDIYDKEKKK
ncbi:hypothetical protein LA345_16090 [Burkholderia vietnamiensis]|nr:hypothetical protein [Burkholderia vietnamiensis]